MCVYIYIYIHIHVHIYILSVNSHVRLCAHMHDNMHERTHACIPAARARTYQGSLTSCRAMLRCALINSVVHGYMGLKLFHTDGTLGAAATTSVSASASASTSPSTSTSHTGQMQDNEGMSLNMLFTTWHAHYSASYCILSANIVRFLPLLLS